MYRAIEFDLLERQIYGLREVTTVLFLVALLILNPFQFSNDNLVFNLSDFNKSGPGSDFSSLIPAKKQKLTDFMSSCDHQSLGESKPAKCRLH